MDKYFIYLAGGMSNFGKDDFNKCNSWREHCKFILENYECDYRVKVTNPNDYYNFKKEIPAYDSQREIMEFDLNKVRNSDLIVVNFNDMHSLGTMAELAIAYEKRIPVIGLDVDKQNLHPWQIEMCNKIFSNIETLLYYIKDYYLM